MITYSDFMHMHTGCFAYTYWCCILELNLFPCYIQTQVFLKPLVCLMKKEMARDYLKAVSMIHAGTEVIALSGNQECKKATVTEMLLLHQMTPEIILKKHLAKMIPNAKIL